MMKMIVGGFQRIIIPEEFKFVGFSKEKEEKKEEPKKEEEPIETFIG